jgi:hypothetical protein
MACDRYVWPTQRNVLLRTVREAEERRIVPLDGHSLNNIFPFCPDVGIAVGEETVVLSTIGLSTMPGDNVGVLNMLPRVLSKDHRHDIA